MGSPICESGWCTLVQQRKVARFNDAWCKTSYLIDELSWGLHWSIWNYYSLGFDSFFTLSAWKKKLGYW